MNNVDMNISVARYALRRTIGNAVCRAKIEIQDETDKTIGGLVGPVFDPIDDAALIERMFSTSWRNFRGSVGL